MLSYPVPNNMLLSDVVKKSQQKCKLKIQQVESKEENADT
jgi:hypothetical protein